ncbi:hypothetical protein DXG03_003271 [Asterophora parasitica]|uniref:Uncharacterized protein n=1 Tax=Asterophora parasitica TaxID=117018 RepID=A0A9P7GBZ0_9AGAR|nr:hypothetical protein DXG03_003271 [Asterophora parasitica]
MFAAARQSLASSLRTASRPVFRAGARRMASSSSHAAPKSDKPWVIGSALVFGPAFAYLVSPSARAKSHSAHNDAHDTPGHKTHQASEPTPEPEPEAAAPEPIIVKDDAGAAEADVSESIKAAADDVPKASNAATTEEPKETSAPVEESSADTEKENGTPQDSGDSEPTNQAVVEGVEPKKAEESS